MTFIRRTVFIAAVACLVLSSGLAAHAAPTCHISGRVYCSEYGTRYKEPVKLVFVAPDGTRYAAPLGEVEGEFEADIPTGVSYMMRIEFSGNGFDVGGLGLPEGCNACAKTVEIYHPGSMLELVWEARAGNGGGSTDFKVKDAQQK